ncbi:molybdopterin-dependent oxidoreductase [Nocardioides sp.]|uniref:molybdopterin-dependent oxidoreductase n=1 Tax=Nocardioides sp. TaxID=35761 RepID=UPI002B26937C|nr:molybdopterin-dependent oxidoreductase [Nocardioides sp.]
MKAADVLDRVPRESDFTSRLRSPAVAARVGLWLGIAFGICFLTGLISHYAQNGDQPVPFPTAPYWGYRVTQGLHVISGTAAIPLLLVKLWSVYPQLFKSMPWGDVRAMTISGLERLSIAVLVAGSTFLLVTGLLNTSRWYPWAFSFRPVHYAVAWITIGALVVHIAVKLPVIRDALTSDVDDTTHDSPTATEPGVVSRRGLLRSTWLATGIAVLATAGSTVPLLRKVSVLSVRTGDGPQGVPFNRTAAAAQVTAEERGPGWTLDVVDGDGVVSSWSRDELAAMTQRTETLPIACVEGWSASAEWTGVRLRDLLDAASVPRGADVRMVSMQKRYAFGVTELQGNFADADKTLIALKLNGEELSLDHGFPARLIAPNRPGVLQTKWLTTVEVI